MTPAGNRIASGSIVDRLAHSVVEKPFSVIVDPVLGAVGYPGEAATTAHAAPSLISICSSAIRVVRAGEDVCRRGRTRSAGAPPGSRGRRTGSCTRSSLGPSAVSISPAYSTPTYGVVGRRVVVEDRLHERAEQFVGRARGPVPVRRPPCRRCSGRCHPRRCACGPARAAAPPPWCRRTGRAASTRGRSASPRARTDRAVQWCGSPPRSRRRSDGTITPLPAASPSSFTTTGPPNCSPPGDRAVGRRSRRSVRTRVPGTPRPSRELTAEPLRRLDTGLLRRRSETRDLAERALVGDAGDQDRLGAGDHEIDVGSGHLAEFVCHRDRVPVLLARPCDGVLAATAADDEHAHQAIAPSNDSLAWASPTAIG